MNLSRNLIENYPSLRWRQNSSMESVEVTNGLWWVYGSNCKHWQVQASIENVTSETEWINSGDSECDSSIHFADAYDEIINIFFSTCASSCVTPFSVQLSAAHFPRIHKLARTQIKCSANFAKASTVRCHLIMPQWSFLCRMMQQSLYSHSVYINTLSLLLRHILRMRARALRRMCSWKLCVQLLLAMLLSIRVLPRLHFL